MRYTYIKLINYIGIFNGMHLNSIEIDLTRCKNRVLTIIGDNGSGKSTLFNAMSVLPDDNRNFIPGQAAYKEIHLQHNNIRYKLLFNHPIKSNGDRDTTKAYISKSVMGDPSWFELNPNGNVTSFKDILYDELGLDPNFIALSQLSTEDKGLASKKPAERKKFVNAIMSSLEVYNDIYKKLMKQSTSMKTMIQSITARLSSIGSEDTLINNLHSIEDQIRYIEAHKDRIRKSIMKAAMEKENIDPDGTIQSKINSLKENIDIATKKLNIIYKKAAVPVLGVPATIAQIEDTVDKGFRYLTTLEEEWKQNHEKYLAASDMIRSINVQIAQKKQTINSLMDDDSFESICDKLADVEAIIQSIKESIPSDLEIELGSITKAEYITALNALKEIKDAVSLFKNNCSSYQSMLDVLNEAKKTDRLQLKDISEYQQKISNYNAQAPMLNEYIIQCDSDIEKLKKLSSRPNTCLDDSCFFIKDLIAIRDSNVGVRRAEAVKRLEMLELCKDDAELQMKLALEYNTNANALNNLIRLITINGAILVRLPHGSIYKDKISFIEALINNQDFSYIDQIYKYINLANLYDEYNVEMRVYNNLLEKKKAYESKSSAIESLNDEIDDLTNKLDRYRLKEKETSIRSDELSESIKRQQAGINNHKDLLTLLKQAEPYYNIIVSGKEEQKAIAVQMQKIADCNATIALGNEQLKAYDKQLTPLYTERDQIKHSLSSIEDYRKELASVQENYNFIEKLRYYSSPTSGIQLVFMEFYMGKIIGLANELLSLLFNGKYVIQPFVITDTEFRIPCLGDGMINDDISSMSSAQISMISMIIGFSLLHNSSTMYNILKLDEIDGPLDETNRILFIDLLNRIMDIMHTEQCILISHNSELDLSNSDVIVLRTDNISSDHIYGNIIWRY